MKIEKPVIYLEKEKGVIDTIIGAIKPTVTEEKLLTIVIASLKGKTAIKFAKKLGKEVKVISVSEFTYSKDIKKQMRKLVITPIEKVSLPIQDIKEMKEGLLMFGAGVKAALEVTAIAAEKELVSDKVIAIAGGKGGLDTALIVKPAKPENFFASDPGKRMSVLRIIALPYREG